MKFILTIALLIQSMSTLAAELTFADSRVTLRGKIEAGDSSKLISIIKQNTYVGMISLDSDGGDLKESFKIAEIVEELNMQANVIKNKVCGSACFFIYLAGTERGAAGIELQGRNLQYGVVAIHRPYLSVQSREQKSLGNQMKIMKTVSDFLEVKLVPRRIIDLMMSRASNDAYFLTIDDIDELGNFSPAIEELFISECHYNKKAFWELLAANGKGDLDAKRQLNELSACETDIVIAAYSRGKAKIMNGWKPKGYL